MPIPRRTKGTRAKRRKHGGVSPRIAPVVNRDAHRTGGILSTSTAFSRQERVRFIQSQWSLLNNPTVVGETPGVWMKRSCNGFSRPSRDS
jgi:hypothetical protein